MQTVLQRTASAVTRTENSLRPILGAWRLPFRHGAAFVLMSGVKPQESFGCSPRARRTECATPQPQRRTQKGHPMIGQPFGYLDSSWSLALSPSSAAPALSAVEGWRILPSQRDRCPAAHSPALGLDRMSVGSPSSPIRHSGLQPRPQMQTSVNLGAQLDVSLEMTYHSVHARLAAPRSLPKVHPPRAVGRRTAQRAWAVIPDRVLD